MQIITDQDVRLLEWAQDVLGEKYHPELCRWAACRVDGGLASVVVYSHFSPRNCVMSIATDGAKRWASRTAFRFYFAIPFVQWGLDRVTFLVSEKNERSLAMLRHEGRFSIGAHEEGRMLDGAALGVDAIVFGLLKRNCKWVPA